MGNGSTYLGNSYATQNGRIQPWGTFSVLFNGVIESPDKGGLPLWSEKLIPHAKAGRHVVVKSDVVDVVDDQGSVVESIPHEEFTTVEIWESYVHTNGYLEASILRKSGDHDWPTKALDQANRGEKPKVLDNSSFTRIDTANARQEVILLEHRSSLGEKVLVYTKDGDLIPSETHYPLSYAKWDPSDGRARHSKPTAH